MRTTIIAMPSRILAETYDDRGQLLNAIATMIGALERGQRVKLDFSRTVKMFPGGMLVLRQRDRKSTRLNSSHG